MRRVQHLAQPLCRASPAWRRHCTSTTSVHLDDGRPQEEVVWHACAVGHRKLGQGIKLAVMCRMQVKWGDEL